MNIVLISIIFILSFFSILSQYYPTKNLINGGRYFLPDELYIDNSYNFFIKAEYKQSVNLEFKINSTLNQSENNEGYIYFYEIEEYEHSTYQYIRREKFYSINNSFFIEYHTHYKKCWRVRFNIQPTVSIKNCYLKVIVKTRVDEEYNLTNTTPYYMEYMRGYSMYKFYIPVKYDQTAEIILKGKTDEKYPNQKIRLYEYLNRDSIVPLYNINSEINYDKNGSFLVPLYRAEKFNTNFFAFEFEFNYSMHDVEIIANVHSPKIYEYRIKYDKRLEIEELSIINTYKFICEAKVGYSIDFFIAIGFLQLSFYMNIYEFADDNLQILLSNITAKFQGTYAGSTIQNCLYKVSNSSTNFVVFEYKPYKNTKNSYIDVDVYLPADFEYDLTNGITQFYKSLNKSKSYKFYFHSKYLEKIEIEIKPNDKFKQDRKQKLTAIQYSERNDPRERSKQIIALDYNYFLSSYLTVYTMERDGDYVAFILIPSYDMNEVNITATLAGKINFLNNGEPIYFKPLFKRSIYKFDISVKYTDYIVLELTEPNDNLGEIRGQIIFYENNYGTDSRPHDYYFKGFDYDNNSKSYKIYHTIQLDPTEHLFIEFIPYDYHASVNIKANIIEYNPEINLKKFSIQSLYIMIKNLSYKFYISAKYNRKILFEYKCNNSYYYNFKINMLEYPTRNSKKCLNNVSISLKPSYINKETMYYLSEPIKVSDKSTKYIAFEIKSEDYIELYSINSLVYNEPEYDVIFGDSQYIGDISANKKIIIYITNNLNYNNFYNTTLNIEFTKTDKENADDQYIKIRELYGKYSLSSLKNDTIQLTYDKNENSYVLSYTVLDEVANYVALELTPLHDMNEVSININVDKNKYLLYYICGGGVLLVIIIIVVIAIICTCCHKKNKENEIKNLEGHSNEDILPIIPGNKD